MAMLDYQRVVKGKSLLTPTSSRNARKSEIDEWSSDSARFNLGFHQRFDPNPTSSFGNLKVAKWIWWCTWAQWSIPWLILVYAKRVKPRQVHKDCSQPLIKIPCPRGHCRATCAIFCTRMTTWQFAVNRLEVFHYVQQISQLSSGMVQIFGFFHN